MGINVDGNDTYDVLSRRKTNQLDGGKKDRRTESQYILHPTIRFIFIKWTVDLEPNKNFYFYFKNKGKGSSTGVGRVRKLSSFNSFRSGRNEFDQVW